MVSARAWMQLARDLRVLRPPGHEPPAESRAELPRCATYEEEEGRPADDDEILAGGDVEARGPDRVRAETGSGTSKI